MKILNPSFVGTWFFLTWLGDYVTTLQALSFGYETNPFWRSKLEWAWTPALLGIGITFLPNKKKFLPIFLVAFLISCVHFYGEIHNVLITP